MEPIVTAAESSATASHVPSKEFTVALAGNPNVGKTTVFNALTGLRQKVANYPGVTVEKKTGRCVLAEHGGKASLACEIIDLPGTYSLASRSPDEHVARRVILGQIEGTPRPDVIVVVADASNLERNLYLVTQVLELGRPVVVALTMADVAAERGKTIDIDKLSRHLRAAVVAIQANKSRENGVEALKAAIARAGHQVHGGRSDAQALSLPLPEVMETHIHRLMRILATEKLSRPEQAYFDAHLMLATGEEAAEGAGDVSDSRHQHPKVRAELQAALQACAAAEVDPIGAEVEAHYAFISAVVADCVREQPVPRQVSRTDRIDRVVTHRLWGMGIFVGLMGVIFWAIFSFAAPAMTFLSDDVFNGLGHWIGRTMAPGPLNSLLTDGIIAGVGNVVAFLPQIALLFVFLAILEDSGYMARAAFLMDRLMSRVGLHGKSFIPLLSGYACAVPAIMGTRVIENRRDRLATILILPLMSCSARLPIYTLLISLFFGYSALASAGVLLALYLLGTFSAFGMAWIFKRTLLKGPAPAFILEMPPYRLPHWRTVATTVGQRCWDFLKRAGTIIFAFSVVMWAATNYPKPAAYAADYDGQMRQGQQGMNEHTAANSAEARALADRVVQLQHQKAREVLESSAAGRAGRLIAPVFYPLGFDWKTSVGVTSAFFAREVIVSTLGICYSAGEADTSSAAFQKAMRADRWTSGARAGQPIWTPLVAITLLVFVVFCMQCLWTLAMVKRETGHWGWSAFMFIYMAVFAWVAGVIVYQGGTWVGLNR
jgi:ferrous iron transport protein B